MKGAKSDGNPGTKSGREKVDTAGRPPSLKEVFTPKQVALALGVSEASVKRWCDSGKLGASRTAGGHRRIPSASVFRYLRESGHTLAKPEVLGLPSIRVLSQRQSAKVPELLTGALSRGEEETFRQLVFQLYLAGTTCAEIFDRFLATVFRELGERWARGELEVYQERRACEICLHLLYDLRKFLPQPRPPALRAIGATLSGDSYALATTMAELVLREAGWNAESLGLNLPVTTLSNALAYERPRLVWVGVSHIPDEESFLREYAQLYDRARKQGISVAVGGRALTRELRSALRYSAFCDQMKDLVSFAATLQRREP